MKKRGLLALLTALLFNAFSGAFAATVIGAPPVFGALALNGVGFLQSFMGYTNGVGVLSVGLNKDVWLGELLQKFRPDPSWLKEARDISMYVNNDVLNLADAGADPGVVINFDGSYDLPVANTEDSDKVIQLYNLSTEQDQIKAALVKTRPYDIMKDRVQRHNDTLQGAQLRLAAYGIAPLSNATYTPVLATTGANDGSGFKAITLNDLIDLNVKFKNENMNINGLKPILVLHPTHWGQLVKEDKALTKLFIDADSEKGFDLCGFKCYVSTATPIYNKTTGVRKAYGAVAAPSTDTISSFAFLPKEAGYAKGTMDMFLKKADPARQSDFINFAVRYFAGSMRSKGIGAIYSVAA